MQNLGFLGPKGSYSHLAAMSYEKRLSDIGEIIEFPTIPAVANAIGKEITLGLLPIENSTEGDVGGTMTYLVQSLLLGRKVFAQGELVVPVKHVLAGFWDIDEIETVYSHPQALAQCSMLLERLHVRQVAVDSTSAGFSRVIEDRDARVAAIGSEYAASASGVPIVRTGVQNNETNSTRFLVVSKNKKTAPPITTTAKTTILCVVRNEPGALMQTLAPFGALGIGLSKISSFPTGENLGLYAFFVDIDGNMRTRNIQTAIARVKAVSLRTLVLGSYESATI